MSRNWDKDLRISLRTNNNGIRHMSDHSEFKTAQTAVFKLQKRIYKATARGDLRQARNLQKLLLNSRSAKIIAVHQVTQLNQGKKTAGIDGKTALTPKERAELVVRLRMWKTWKHQALREIPIKKKNGKTRMLKIPTISDRAYQCLLKLALEPAHEVTFHERSYGFRTGRGAHDAQRIVYNNLNSHCNGKTKRVLELDISLCFDKIEHKSILEKLIAPKWAIKGIKLALKAGINPEFPTQGAPQGGVISPLLANIALNGIENIHSSVRYADDMVIFLKPADDEEAILTKLQSFLAERGLTINEEKTKVTPTTTGFNFLGWTFINKPNGKLTCYPTQESKKAITKKVKNIITKSGLPTAEKVEKLAPIVRGWRNYHKYCDMSGNNSLWSLNHWTWKRLNKNKNASTDTTNSRIRQAFPAVSSSLFRFACVKGNKSPYDGDVQYWAVRNSKLYDNRTATAIKKQGNRCGICGTYLTGEQPVELHHINGRHSDNMPKNLSAVHRSCHIDLHSVKAKGITLTNSEAV